MGRIEARVNCTCPPQNEDARPFHYIGCPALIFDRPREVAAPLNNGTAIPDRPDPPPDYPGLTDPDGAMVAFAVRLKSCPNDPGPYLPAYLAGWFLCAAQEPLPATFNQFRESIRAGYADCQERQAARRSPATTERGAIASDLLHTARGYSEAGDEGMATIFRQRAARVMAGKHWGERE